MSTLEKINQLETLALEFDDRLEILQHQLDRIEAKLTALTVKLELNDND